MKKYLMASNSFDYGTVYKFRIYYEDGLDDIDKQYRYVLAKTEYEAVNKLEAYNQYMTRLGFASFTFGDPVVEDENIII